MKKSGKNGSKKSQQRRRSPSAKGGASRRPTEIDEKSAIKEKDADNDVTWYARNAQMMRAAASFPFSQSLGTKLLSGDTEAAMWHPADAIPGLMVLRYVPTPAGNDSESDTSDSVTGKDSPINIAANGIYTTIRSHQSGGKNYDPPNLMLYLLAMDNIYAFYSWMVRIYGVMPIYSQRNRYLPEMLVTASGVDYDDIKGRLAEFRYYINLFAAKASSLCVPAILPYYQRHFWLSQNVFADDQTLKAQLYMFNPACFFQYAPKLKLTTSSAESPTPGLKAVFPIDQGTAYTLDDIKVAGDRLLQAVITDEDINIMSGDILKAYGEGSLFKLSAIPAEFAILPVYSEEVLTQIHNARIVGVKSPSWRNPESTQDYANNAIALNCIKEKIDTSTATGYLRNHCAPFYISAAAQPPVPDASCNVRSLDRIATWSLHQMLNMHKDDVSPEDVMIATRLMPSVRAFTTDPGGTNARLHVELSGTGSEWLANATVYYWTWNSSGERTIGMTEFRSSMSAGSIASLAKLTIFQQHPIFDIVSSRGSGVQRDAIFGDIDNYTFIDNESLRRVHETALMSEFAVPLLGVF